MMKSPSAPERVPVHLALLISAIMFFSCTYFFEGGCDNQNSRFDLMRAIVERDTPIIDAYHENTGDKAFFAGHYYSDKAPGVALLGVPAIAAARPVMRWFGIDPSSRSGLVALAYIATLLAVALPSSLGAGCLFLIGVWLGATLEGSAFAALSLGLATPYWPNSNMLFGHTLAGACLTFSFAAALALRHKGAANRDFILGMTVGLTAGWATVTEYPAAPVSAVLALLALTVVWSDGWTRRLRIVIAVTVGALPCIAALMTYQYLAFGSPFDLGYSHYAPGAFPLMQTGFHGLRRPHLVTLGKILVGPYSGLLLLGPVIVAAPFGLRSLWKDVPNRVFAVAAATIAGYYLCFNASFIEWRGGASYGPRYMLAGLPALCVGLAPAWSKAARGVRWGLASLAAAGLIMSLAAMATNPIQSALAFSCPILQSMLPAFFAGQLSTSPSSVVLPENATAHEAFNLGKLAGLHGLVSLVPLLVLWCIGGIAMVKLLRKQETLPSEQSRLS
jgi:hypothetical protein